RKQPCSIAGHTISRASAGKGNGRFISAAPQVAADTRRLGHREGDVPVRSRMVKLLAVAIVTAVGVWTAPATASPAAPRAARPAAFVGKTIPFWTGSVAASQNGKQYRYQMVGQDPRVPLTHPATRIVANIIPIVVKLAN